MRILSSQFVPFLAFVLFGQSFKSTQLSTHYNYHIIVLSVSGMRSYFHYQCHRSILDTN